jgi:hypothetical protein
LRHRFIPVRVSIGSRHSLAMSISYRHCGYNATPFDPLSTSFFPHRCYNRRNARVLRVFHLKKVSEKMPKSLEEGPSDVRRLRIPASLDRRIRENLRPGEIFSEVARGLLGEWCSDRELPIERKETARLRRAVARKEKVGK